MKDLLTYYFYLRLLFKSGGSPITRYECMVRARKAGFKIPIQSNYYLINTLIKNGWLERLDPNHFTLSSNGIRAMLEIENKIRFILAF